MEICSEKCSEYQEVKYNRAVILRWCWRWKCETSPGITCLTVPHIYQKLTKNAGMKKGAVNLRLNTPCVGSMV